MRNDMDGPPLAVPIGTIVLASLAFMLVSQAWFLMCGVYALFDIDTSLFFSNTQLFVTVEEMQASYGKIVLSQVTRSVSFIYMLTYGAPHLLYPEHGWIKAAMLLWFQTTVSSTLMMMSATRLATDTAYFILFDALFSSLALSFTSVRVITFLMEAEQRGADQRAKGS